MPAIKIKQNRFQMSYKKDEVPKYEAIEQFLMEDLGVYKRSDIYKYFIRTVHNLRKKAEMERI